MTIEIAEAVEAAASCWLACLFSFAVILVLSVTGVAERIPVVVKRESKLSNGDLYVDRGRRGVGALTGGYGVGALGDLPVAAPLRIHGQRSAIVRFGEDCLETFCGLFVDAFGFSSSLELDTKVLAPAMAPRGSLTLYPKIESPSMEY